MKIPTTLKNTNTVVIFEKENKTGNYKEVNKGKGKFLYSAVSNPKDCSKCFTLYFPAITVQ